MKKILLIAENWPPRIDGIENYLYGLTAELAKSFKIAVVAPVDKNAHETSGSISVPVLRHRFFNGLVRPKWIGLYRRIQKLIREEDISMVFCGKALFEGQAALRLKRQLGVDYVVFTYAMEIEQWQKSFRNRVKLKKVLREASKVAYINNQTRNLLKDLGVREDQLIEVLPGVAERFLKPVAEEVALGTVRHYGIKQPYIACVCRLVARKGVDDLIEAFVSIDQVKHGDWQLVIIGSGPEEETLRKLARLRFADKNIKFLNSVPDRHLPALYTASEIFALTPKEIKGDSEGFGMVYTEASACGKPILGTRTGGIPQAVRDQETGILVRPNSSEDILKGLEELISDPQKRMSMGQKGQEIARTEWTWEKRCARLKEWLAEKGLA